MKKDLILPKRGERCGATLRSGQRLNETQTRILVTTARSWRNEMKKQEEKVQMYKKMYDAEVKKLDEYTQKYEALVDGVEFDVMLEDV